MTRDAQQEQRDIKERTGVGSVWERSRMLAKQEILETAFRLFTGQGFEETTIAQIAREAGVSQRTLFRYFGTKEDLVLGDHAEYGRLLQAALESRPADERPWTALRAAFASLAESLPYSPEDILKITSLLDTSPSLRARQLERRQQWTDLLVPDITRRLDAPSDPMTQVRAQALVTCALACSEIAVDAWGRSNGTVDLERAYDAAVAAVRAE
ncbi:TetR/AcrR family transcriptional regulator [Streptomyces olivochromogenes]|uniref:TetR/AcrR family transcriptional regulator n=1 Tax=Streptomyces olivochromogenes TaxID=1963 RepID=UPI001F3786FD|nr:TetR/AcrR family transcriptional regulator [Streptomyces olivochromogenes]MCF3135428.1 TetR family transcriptional regulator [Streptomyces olivochromogenes]